MAQFNSNGTIFAYTLEELAEAFHAPKRLPPDGLTGKATQPKAQPEGQQRQEGQKPHTRRRDWTAINRQRLNRFVALMHCRQGVGEGQRAVAVFLFAALLKLSRVRTRRIDPARLEHEIQEFNQTYCDPPLSDADCQSTAKSVAGFTRGLRTQTIAERMNITADEAQATRTWGENCLHQQRSSGPMP